MKSRPWADNERMKDDRGIVLNWLVKLIIGLAIGGVILFDAGSILVNFFGLDGAADEIANMLATDVSSGKLDLNDEGEIEEIARKEARKRDAKLTKFEIDAKARIHVRLKSTADTIVVSRISPIEDWAVATAEGQAATQ
jgi:hypothetical protein